MPEVCWYTFPVGTVAHREERVLGDIDVELKEPISHLLTKVKDIIAIRNAEGVFANTEVRASVKQAATRLGSDSGKIPKFSFKVTLYNLDEHRKVLGKANLSWRDWQRFERLCDFSRSPGTLDKGRISIQIGLDSDDEGHPVDTGVSFDASNSALFVPQLPGLADSYVRVGTVQPGNAKPNTTGYFNLLNSKAGEIAKTHMILAKLQGGKARQVADNLFAVSAWRIDKIDIGSIYDSIKTTFEEVDSQGTGLFSPFQASGKDDRTSLDGLVEVEYQHQDNVARGLADMKHLGEKKYAMQLPPMTLNNFKPESIGNELNCTFGRKVKARVAIRVVYYMGSQKVDHKTLYPQSMQTPIAADTNFKELEDTLFQAFGTEEAAAGQPPDRYRTGNWWTEWWIMSRPEDKNRMYRVEEKGTTIATYVAGAEGMKGNVHLYTECHIRSKLYDYDKIGNGLN